jgi:Mg-chelatase subunit ChlD
MASSVDHASKIAWMVASAVQETNGRVHLIGFADQDKNEVLLSPSQFLERGFYTSYGSYGGTYIHEALQQAHKVLSASYMPNRLLTIITDGGWGDLKEALEVIKKINALDAETVLMLMGMHLERNQRGCKHVAHVNDIKRAGDELKKIITKIEGNAVRRVTQNRGFVLD